MQEKGLGTFAVFMTAISTILGAILFLRFGFAVAHVGLLWTMAIIVLGHLVTIPTALAVAEIATNQKVEGGGAYYMISRSFGLSIGGAIGIALFLSQAISVAFYIIAFTVSTRDVLAWLEVSQGIVIAPWQVNYGFMSLLTLLMLTKGAQVGVKALYGVVAVLVVALLSFFFGSGEPQAELDILRTIDPTFVTEDGRTITRYSFIEVFTFIFPAFTGIAAGLGLSGDLKEPARAIPRGTLWATLTGIIVYIIVALKFWVSASPEQLASDQLYMEAIAIWPPLIPMGLAAAAVSSALGSVIIAPRTLQALALDRIFPKAIGLRLRRGRKSDNEPIVASIVTCAIGFVFVSLGDINAVAEIISMFFMVTYGAICLVSLFEHFAASPGYRPTFRSHWLLSLIGAVTCFYLMFLMNFSYALGSLVIMAAIYAGLSRRGERGMVALFRGMLFQLSRYLQLTLQRRDSAELDRKDWRPMVLGVSQDTFRRPGAFDMVRWIAHRQGFGTYVHLIEGRLDARTFRSAVRAKQGLADLGKAVKSRVSMSTVVSPSYTSAIAQCVQLPGISGQGNNAILLEYIDEQPQSAVELVANYDLLRGSNLDLCLLRSSFRGFGEKRAIHIWVTPEDSANANLMILMAYVLQGHPDWRESHIEVFSIYRDGDRATKEQALRDQIQAGRIPVSQQNIEMVEEMPGDVKEDLIDSRSKFADLTFIGFNDADIRREGVKLFEAHHGIGNILFVDAHEEVALD
jgi:amino acid transporter